MTQAKPSAFLLIQTTESAFTVLKSLQTHRHIVWASPVYGPYQLVAYLQADDHAAVARETELIRTQPGIAALDARICKALPGDELLTVPSGNGPIQSVLLINVDLRLEKERVVTYNLRKIDGIFCARAMWGPADIVAMAHAQDHEAMRNLICDEVKIMHGVKSNTTLYCYPGMDAVAAAA